MGQCVARETVRKDVRNAPSSAAEGQTEGRTHRVLVRTDLAYAPSSGVDADHFDTGHETSASGGLCAIPSGERFAQTSPARNRSRSVQAWKHARIGRER